MGRSELHRFRRRLNAVEEEVLVSGSPGVDVEGALDALAPMPEQRARVAELADVAAGRAKRAGYLDRHGACGVRPFTTAGGRKIFLLPIETFPDHVNNVYLIVDGAKKFLVDTGSLVASARDDFARAARVLEKVHGLTSPFDGIGD